MSNPTAEDNRESLLEFPCDFPIKVMGRDNDTFRTTAIAIIETHLEPPEAKLAADAVRSSRSRKANFVSLTITIQAISQDQLDNIYRDLSAHEEILVAL